MGSCDSKCADPGVSEIAAEPAAEADRGVLGASWLERRHASLQSLPQRNVQRMGWKKDIPDHRDHHVKFKDVEPRAGTRKRSDPSGKLVVDLRPTEDFPIFNQGNLGSCTANALAAAFHFTVHKMTMEDHADFRDFTPSRLFIYYNERYVEGFVRWDLGGMLRDGIKTMAKVGVCPEKVWSYDDTGDKFKQEPEWFCYELAKKCKVVGYARVAQELSQMKMCIRNGYPFVFGFSVFPSFQTKEVSSTGKMIMPLPDEEERGTWRFGVLGMGIIRAGLWGDKGYFYMPYAYICNPDLANDFWSIEWVQSFDNAGPGWVGVSK
ncbi:unnamed protein product [Symbiodinium natans]|uniref:Peptidase C1A papain C-terminal domain-containing protein n=1 Tax=Symbiodinium natans TaxID=878477 RepID=A0A812QFD2_9DINO|nr:unnamed protein product [Symbiodinium natans]